MPPMPKHLTKGKYFNELDRLHSDPAKKRAALKHLRDGNPLQDLEGIATVAGAAGRNHVKRDWLGEGRMGPFGSTGWWRNWRGDPEKTLRCAAIRGLEISMGLTHYCPCHSPSGLPSPDPPDSANPYNAKRELPIDYHWVCGPSRFEAYVTWNEHQVTVIVITPGFPDDNDPSLPVEMEEFPSDNLSQLDTWALREKKGTIFIGQDEEIEIDNEELGKTITIMKPGVVTHHLDIPRGGSGGPFP